MLSKCVIAALLASVVYARSATTSQNAIPQETARSEESNSFYGDLRFVYKVYQECAAADLSSCLKLKLISAMDRVARAYSEVPIFSGVSFVKDPKAAAEAPVQSETELEATLPRALTEREDALNTIIADKISNFFQSHTLQVKFPSASELQRSFDESRGKKKKMAGLLLIPLILGGTLVPLALGALALLAGKALIVSKLALVLAGIIGLKKLLTGNTSSGHEAGHDVHVGTGHGSGWGRSYEKEQAQNLAYNGYAPKTR